MKPSGANGEVEGAEEFRERVRVVAKLPGRLEAQLEVRPLRHDGNQEHQGREQPQVGRVAYLSKNLGNTMGSRGLGTRARLPPGAQPLASHDDDDRTRQDEGREHQQHVDRAADGIHENAREHAPGDRSEGGAGPHEREQPACLPQVEQRVGEAPGLDRRDHAEAVHPHIKRRRQPVVGCKGEGVPEGQHVQAEKHQGADGHPAHADLRRQLRVHRQEHPEHDRNGRVDVGERVRPVLLQKKAVAKGLRQQEGCHHEGDVEKRKENRKAFAAADVEEPPHPGEH